MPHSLDNLRSVILCDDVRAEVGNKWSVMGVIGGDVLVPDFPAMINIAFFMQYYPSPDEEGAIRLHVRLLQDDEEIVKGRLDGVIPKTGTMQFVLQRALVRFDKESSFRMMMSLEGGEEREVLSRRIIKADS